MIAMDSSMDVLQNGGNHLMKLNFWLGLQDLEINLLQLKMETIFLSDYELDLRCQTCGLVYMKMANKRFMP